MEEKDTKNVVKKKAASKKSTSEKKEMTKKTASTKKMTTKKTTIKKESTAKKVVKKGTPKKRIKKEIRTLEEKTVKMVPLEITPQKLEQPDIVLRVKPEVKVSEKSVSKKEKTKKSTFHMLEVCILIGITAVMGILVGIICSLSFLKEDIQRSQLSDELQEFVDNYQYIVENYYDEVDKKDLIDSAIAGMLKSLGDPYSNYMDESATSDFDVNLMGTYKGLGLEVYNDTDYNIIVSRVFENTPAGKAGLQVGDILISLDGESMVGRPTTDFANLVKNGDKDTYRFEVKRGNETLSYELKRETVIIPSVYSHVYEKNGKKIGHLEITIFSATTYNQFKTQLEKLEKQGIEGLVIDVRDNSGGHLNVVADMISLFMDKSHVIYQIQSKSNVEKFYSTGSVNKTYPIVVLQNQSSASASELMSAALQEQYGATVIGMTSYGKGTVQELKELSDGTQYKFTTKKWLTPKGNWINEKGVKPDVEVDLRGTYFENPVPENDNQLQTALDVVSKK